jgi:plastocyanin
VTLTTSDTEDDPMDSTQHPMVPDSRRLLTRRAVLRAASGAALLAGGGLLAGCGDPGTARNDHDEITVAMTDDMRFDPDPVTVRSGTTIRFENTSARLVHTATCDPALAGDPANVALPGGADAWSSGNVAPEASWAVTLDVPGEYRYVCLPHELAGMIGTIVVEAA